MRRTALFFVLLTVAPFVVACDVRVHGRADPDAVPAGDWASAAVPVEHDAGRAVFDRSCAACHGPAATGTRSGPPLVHPVYAPDHHADAAFHLAVARGVRAHHWRFGNMPPVRGVSEEEVDAIVGYIRWLQREAGLE